METVSREVEKASKKGRTVAQGTLGAVATILTGLRATRAALLAMDSDYETKTSVLRQLASTSAEAQAKYVVY